MYESPAFLQVQCDTHVGALHLQCIFELRQQWTVLFGASGSGKSSLLRLLAGFWRPPGCSIVLHGRQLKGRAAYLRRICYVGQQPSLFPHLDVMDNVHFGAKGRQQEQRAGEVLDYLRIAHLRKASVPALSGGETQRVAIARALLSDPELLLLDESFTGMHEDLRTELIGLLREQSFLPSLRLFSVTHSVAEAFISAGEVIRISEGKILAQGPCEQVLAEPRRQLLAQLDGNVIRSG